ncbi:MAG: DUF3306 domain-containing protein [Roseobacter sp.]
MSELTSYWARRRAAVQAEADAEARKTQELRDAARERELAEKDDSEILEEMGLPDPDQMQMGDDFAAFMARDVPERLRRQALRTLWRSNPVLACVDGLNDYDDDYRAAMMVQEPVKTAYQVGKGMLRHIEEMARKAEAAERQPQAETQDSAAYVAQEQTAAVNEPVQAERKQPATAPDPSAVAVSQPEAAPAAARHMRFRFEEAAG